jgi:hypothetical protein
MKSPCLLALSALVLIPSVALGGEPSKGTVITIASVGLWLIISSVGIVIRSRRDGAKGDAGAKKDETNDRDSNA